jgi:transcriptional regulator with XRE-family HTH domain
VKKKTVKPLKIAKSFKPLDEKEALQRFGKRLKMVRKTAQKSQLDLAFEKDINLRRLSAWETGSDIRLTSIIRVCNALEISLSEFFAEGFE